MKANYGLDMNRKKRDAVKMANQFVKNAYGKKIDALTSWFNRVIYRATKFASILSFFHTVDVMAAHFGIGRDRLAGFMAAYIECDSRWKQELEDGIGFTATRKRLEKRGFVFDEKETAYYSEMERMYEKNVSGENNFYNARELRDILQEGDDKEERK